MTLPSLPEDADLQGTGGISSSSSASTTPPMTPTTIDGEEATVVTSKARTLAQPAANTFDRYGSSGSGWGTVTLRMVPDPNAHGYRAAPWAACLTVRCEHVARLMDEGFHWSADNLLPDEGSMSRSLHEAPGRKTPRWVARLEVISPFLDVLAAFPLLDLSPAHVCSANAWDPRGKLVYNYNCRTPGRNYNCIYDDRPLRGWWPWPKKGTPTEAPSTLAALTATPRVSEEDSKSKNGSGSGQGDELFPYLPVKPLVRPPRRPQPQLSQDELEAYRQRLNQYRESLVRYQASLNADDMWFERAGGGCCVFL
ncbi:hypothetical protein C8A05DRAFT_39847, partial [Staphylotrichum tortipilum]